MDKQLDTQSPPDSKQQDISEQSKVSPIHVSQISSSNGKQSAASKIANDTSDITSEVYSKGSIDKKNMASSPHVNAAKTEKSSKVRDLGGVLVDRGMISQDQLIVAIKQQAQLGKSSLGEILVSLGFVSETALSEAISSSSGIDKFDIKSASLDNNLIKKIPKDIAMKYKLIPISFVENRLCIAMTDVFDVVALDRVKKFFSPEVMIEPVYSPESELLDVIDQYYEYDMSIDGILKELEGGADSLIEAEQAGVAEDYRNPVVRLVDSILIDAVHCTASDIHFEPEESFLRIRYRIDGQLQQIKTFHKDYWSPVAVRIKIMSSMNIAESRKSQDGHASANILGRDIDFRVATQPTVHGENIVMRILDKTKSLVSIEELGFSKHNIDLLAKMLKKPEGIIVVTGPTGCGKTTTLYSILNYINTIHKNIMTLEDPVEYQLPMIRQSEVKKGSITFVDGIKSLMRQDPDVIFVGEVRDVDTANISLRAAMTGHQVFTTLHTNDAVGVIPRLVDIGIRPFLLSGALVCCLAQRLCRILCKDCKTEKVADETDCKILGIDPNDNIKIYQHVGCEECMNTGYKGRTAVAELFVVSRSIDEMIALNSTTNAMLQQAMKEGFQPMAIDGIRKVMEGVTDIDELIRSVDMTERL
jgi:type IV pilus assembly protein PilB